MTAADKATPTATATLPPKVAAFLDAYEAGPGAIPTGAREPLDLTDTVSRMRVKDTPFTYGIIDDFLPRNVYETVLRDWPQSSFNNVEMATAPDADVGSRKVQLIEDSSEPSNEGAVGIWKQVGEALRAPSFVRGLFNRFADVIGANVTSLSDVALSKPGFRFYRCFEQGTQDALRAHFDVPWKLITIVVYVKLTGAVTEDSEEFWGTSLYKAEPGAYKPLEFTPNADHELATRVHFIPNRAFIMPNSSRALHGVAGGQADVQRRTLMCGYRASGPE